MSGEAAEHGPCPLAWGDRVDHAKFGFGAVESEPVPVFGPDMTPGHYGSRASGWIVTVRWDDPARPPSKIGYQPTERPFLIKVSSPDARGHAYWEHELGKLLKPVERARAEVDGYVKSTFRTREPFSAARMMELREREAAALAALQAFLEADAAGEHP